MCVVCVYVRCACVLCVSDVSLCEMCVCVWLLLFGFRFAGVSVVVLLACSVNVLWVFVDSCCVLFRFVQAFELIGCCAFFVLGCLLLVRLLARFHCVVYVGVSLSWMRYFLFRSASCWPGGSPLDWPCVMCFAVYAPADARWCARRLAKRTLVTFCSFKVVGFFCGSCFGALCVVVCWMFGGAVGWLVGGGTKVSGS